MEIIEKCLSRWNRNLYCVGGVHTNFGCGSMLSVEVSDLFYVYKYKNGAFGQRRPELLVVFQCPVCGLGTVVAREGSKEWTKWFDNLHKRNPHQDDDPQGTEQMKALHLAFVSFVRWCKDRNRTDSRKRSKQNRSEPRVEGAGFRLTAKG
jgi:hypothetical protein